MEARHGDDRGGGGEKQGEGSEEERLAHILSGVAVLRAVLWRDQRRGRLGRAGSGLDRQTRHARLGGGAGGGGRRKAGAIDSIVHLVTEDDAPLAHICRCWGESCGESDQKAHLPLSPDKYVWSFGARDRQI